MLTRRLRQSGDALVLSIPAQIIDVHELHTGDSFAWEILDAGIYKVKRVLKEA